MTFLNLYKEFAEEVTDSPPNYHEYVGIATAGIALGNKIYLPFGDTRIYPNIWLIILGDSSYARKTTSINIGKRLLYEAMPERIYPNEFSQEKIQAILENNPSGAFFFSEFLTLMGLLSRDYMSATKSFLADIFDSPYKYRRETEKRSVLIENPAISIISATTQSWFTKGMVESDIIGGFIPRFLMVMPGKKTKIIAIPPEADKDKRATLINWLKEFQKINGTCYLKPEAKSNFEKWYETLAMWPSNGRMQPFLNRLQIYTLKFSIILNVINEMTYKISGESMNQAIDMIKKVCKDITHVEENELVFGKVQIDMKKIMDYIRRHGKAARSTLLMNTRLSSRDFGQAIQTLMESEQVIETKVKTSRKPISFYEARQI